MTTLKELFSDPGCIDLVEDDSAFPTPLVSNLNPEYRGGGTLQQRQTRARRGLRKHGLCGNCGAAPRPGGKYCERCTLLRRAASLRQWRKKQRLRDAG